MICLHPREILKEIFSEIILVIRKEQSDDIPDLGMAMGMHIVEDIYPEIGPISGVYTGLAESVNNKAFVIGGDYPFLSSELIFSMIKKSKKAVYQSIVSIAGPSIIADLGGFEYYAWLFSGFSLTSAVCAPFVGKLTKIYGPKKIMIPSLFIFLIATILCGLSTSMFMLIFFRSIQGIGLAGVLGVVWIMIALLWSPKERGKWLGATAAGFTLAGLIGPFLGAYITQFFGWRTAFFVVVPAILISMLLILTLFSLAIILTVSLKFSNSSSIKTSV